MSKSSTNGYFVISLDFELLWGVFDKVDPEEKKTYFQNTRRIIPELLKLFIQKKVSCTWAIVGMLFNRNWNEWNENIPEIIPDYSHSSLSAYHFGEKFQNQINMGELCFAKELVDEISATPGQEIGSHTYSHYYCLEDGQDVEAFRADLEKNISIAKKAGIPLKSLVFPRNQFNESYLKVCFELGIKNVRANPQVWYWKDTANETLLSKVFRTGDAYVGLKTKSYNLSALRKEPGKPLVQMASRLLRPYSKNFILNRLRLNRIKSEMTLAAKHGHIYHLWWHPHNFGNFPKKNLADLITILEHYQDLNTEYGFQSKSMQELNNLVL